MEIIENSLKKVKSVWLKVKEKLCVLKCFSKGKGMKFLTKICCILLLVAIILMTSVVCVKIAKNKRNSESITSKDKADMNGDKNIIAEEVVENKENVAKLNIEYLPEGGRNSG